MQPVAPDRVHVEYLQKRSRSEAEDLRGQLISELEAIVI
jgi:hypothetical protein